MPMKFPDIIGLKQGVYHLVDINSSFDTRAYFYNIYLAMKVIIIMYIIK